MRKLLAAVAAAGVVTAGVAAPASARWLTPDPNIGGVTNATLRVDDTARVSRDGLSVAWPVQFSCPRGEAYSLSLWAGERDPVAIPDLAGEDSAIWARSDVAGVCTGKQQSYKKPLAVTLTTYTVRATGEVVTALVPISASRVTSSQAMLSSATGFALWCSAPNCAGETGPRIRLR